MKDRRLLLTSSLLVAGNLLPLGGVLLFDWSVYEVVLLFWAENLVIGLYAVARMVTLYRRNGDRRNLLLIPFFCFHFGAFSLGHLIFVISTFRPEHHAAGGTGMSLWIPFLALLISHGASYILNFLGKQEYRDMTGEQAMMAPYKRVIVLHVTILAGGLLVTLLGQPVAALALLVALKIIIDVMTHLREHREKQAVETAQRQTGRPDGHVFRTWD